MNDEYFGLILLDHVSTNRERRGGRKRVTSISLGLVRKRNHNMKINRIDINGFAAIRHEWNQLLQNSGSNSIFLRWEWVHAWWTVFADQSKELYVLTAIDSEGQLIGVSPCYIARKKKFRLLPIKEVRFLGNGGSICSEYLDFITESRRRNEIVRDFFNYFLHDKMNWDILNLTDLLEHSSVIGYANELGRNNGVHSILGKSSRCPYALLPDSWESYIGNLSKSTRYNIKRKTRKLEHHFDVNLYEWSDIDTIEFAVDKLAELHNRRWEQQNIPHSFSEELFKRFHQEIAREFLKLGLLRLHVLETDGIIVAMLYCFKYEDKIFYYQSGFDPDYSKYSLGTVLFAYAIQSAIAEHVREFDFLRGTYDFKYHWANEERETSRLVIRRDNLTGRVYFFDEFGKEEIKDRLRKHVPETVLESLRSLRESIHAGG